MGRRPMARPDPPGQLDDLTIFVCVRGAAPWIEPLASSHAANGLTPIYLLDPAVPQSLRDALTRIAAPQHPIALAGEHPESALFCEIKRLAKTPWALRLADGETPSQALIQWLARRDYADHAPVWALPTLQLFIKRGRLGYLASPTCFSSPAAPGANRPLPRLFRPHDLQPDPGSDAPGFAIANPDRDRDLKFADPQIAIASFFLPPPLRGRSLAQT